MIWMAQTLWGGGFALALMLGAGAAAAFEIGKTGISLNFPETGWKVEDHDDAAIKVWHLRANSWDPVPGPSGLIAVTLSHLDGDPWPDIAGLRDAAAGVVADSLMTGVARRAPYEIAAGRYQVAGADLEGALDMGAADFPISARVLVIRTGQGALLITAFSKLSAPERPFAGLFGADGILTAHGPGAEALNGTPQPAAAPAPQTPEETGPSVEDLLNQMGKEFAPADQETAQ